MNKVKFNGTDLSVTPICLGTVNYDADLPKAEAKRQLSQYVDRGGNFIDSAHIYGDWVPGVLCRSERTIGEWIKETGSRDKLVISTKGTHPDWDRMDIPRVRPVNIEKDLHESLEYLNTDYIDLYFLHRDDPNVPVSEIIDYLDSAQKQGKIRYYGCSNWSQARIREAAEYAKQTGRQGFVANQLMWSLADVNFYNLPDKTFILMDQETHDYHAETGMNVMAYMSIAKGYFERRYAGEKLPSSVTEVYNSPTNDQIYERCLDMVKNGEYSFMDLSFMYIMGETAFLSVPIASFDNEAQLETGLAAWNKPLPAALLSELGAIKKYIYR